MRSSLLLILSLLSPCLADAQPGTPNTAKDDYAAAFRVTPKVTEFWYTTEAATKDGRSRTLVRSNAGRTGLGEATAAEFPVVQMYVLDSLKLHVALDGSPTFSRCDGNLGVFASNRLVGDRNSGNDLYQMRMEGGTWQVTRLDQLNTDAWEDTPALSPDGTTLFFTSDRLRPGTRLTDIFVSRREGSGWSSPRPVAAVNTEAAAEESPYVGEDGYFYYSTNKNGDFDLWRTRLDKDGMPTGTPEAIPFKGVNRKGSDETHPLFSPGGRWFLYSTNAGANGRKDFDILWTAAPSSDMALELDVRLRKRDASGNDATEGISAPITVLDVTRGATNKYTSGANGYLKLDFRAEDQQDPFGDLRYRELIITGQAPSPKYVASKDTVVLQGFCGASVKHTLFMWDTAAYMDPKCEQNFPIYQVRFFITGYWCPTTNMYQGYTPCNTMFVDPACKIAPCASNDLYRYSTKIERVNENCVDYKEFELRGPEFATEVDSAIGLLREAMRSAFGIPCLDRAIQEKKKVRVEVIGYTDPRTLKGDCLYTGEDVDSAASFVKLSSGNMRYFKNGQRFREVGKGGNQLLSDLRAYFTAVLLDSVWSREVGEYKELKDKNQIELFARGEAVSTEGTSMERQRSIKVRVYLPEAEVRVRAGLKAEPGRRVVLCADCAS